MTLTKPSQDGRDALDFSSSDNGVRIRTVPKLRQTSFVVPSFRFDRFSLACQDCVSIGLLAFAALLAMDDDSASSLSRFLPPPSGMLWRLTIGLTIDIAQRTPHPEYISLALRIFSLCSVYTRLTSGTSSSHMLVSPHHRPSIHPSAHHNPRRKKGRIHTDIS